MLGSSREKQWDRFIAGGQRENELATSEQFGVDLWVQVESVEELGVGGAERVVHPTQLEAAEKLFGIENGCHFLGNRFIVVGRDSTVCPQGAHVEFQEAFVLGEFQKVHYLVFLRESGTEGVTGLSMGLDLYLALWRD